MYHAIGKASNQYIVGQEQLRAQLESLKSDGYVVEGFEQLEARILSGRGLPARYIVMTVDDGDESSLRSADLVGQYGYQATFFLTRDASLKMPGFLREPEIRELRKRGFSLGTHGTSHGQLSLMEQDRCLAELRESKQWLEDVLGEIVRYLSAPHGRIDRRTLQVAYEQGYILAGTSREYMNSVAGISLPGQVDRVAVRRQFSMRQFQSIVEGDLGFYLWRHARAAALKIPKRILRR
jgi:peptidoglycan/xylan/chitin deacetylase (PgdA/CDA1 family)